MLSRTYIQQKGSNITCNLQLLSQNENMCDTYKLLCNVICNMCKVTNAKGPVTQPKTHESRKNYAQTGFVRACACLFVESKCVTGPLRRSGHTAKTHEPRKNYAQIFVSAQNVRRSAQSVRRMRNSSVEQTWTISDCK